MRKLGGEHGLLSAAVGRLHEGKKRVDNRIAREFRFDLLTRLAVLREERDYRFAVLLKCRTQAGWFC